VDSQCLQVTTIYHVLGQDRSFGVNFLSGGDELVQAQTRVSAQFFDALRTKALSLIACRDSLREWSVRYQTEPHRLD
jgi:hypothetical protein